MDASTPEYSRLRHAVTAHLNAHDLLGVMDQGAAEDEYDPEMEDFVRLIAEGVTITPEVVADVWHKWFGDTFGGTIGEPGPPSLAMAALAADLQAVRHGLGHR